MNKTLNVIGKHPTGKCGYCQEIETVEHVLIQCGQYERERERLRSCMREKGIQEIETVEHVLIQCGQYFNFFISPLFNQVG
jgi:hypothetical protein